ncbi:ABC transporter permease [Curtobacterium sp. MCJR17_055]|uniref:ABC transporter permease n=1 Tax=unclassified Curtobacterium TaxID=257496 RepID=UPI000D8566B6|nr:MULTISPECIES: ABC transporter permease [unclassified Curtobacterium]PYY36818.1 ABC transporter permease [Curtobacterium sp. MCBD17_029]PYY58071.1 ABC transporter permease [Curtobacterium sp. MCPF17_015]PYY58521.1 ABC transporter permease [Curtobacterium sp. MCJR17_055]
MSARRSVSLTTGIVLVGLVVVAAVVSLVWLPYSLYDTSGGRLTPPGAAHWLGTDTLGRDLATQLLIGARIALATGLGAVLVGGVLGTAIGLAAAFARPWLDDTLSAVLDIVIAFPTLLVAMLLVAARGASLGTAIVAIGLVMAAVVARLVRILARRVLRHDYVTAARTSGTTWPRIVTQHVLPNIWPTLAVNLALQFGLAVLAEASLSYLGLGAPPPNASWGRMLQDAQQTAFEAPAGVLAPGLALVVLVIGANLLADGLRDVADPTRRGRRAARGAAPGLPAGAPVAGDGVGTAIGPVASATDDPDGRPA